MPYQNLQDLFYHSSSSRRFFLSLSVPMQLAVSEHANSIHTAAELHETVRLVEKQNHAAAISESLFRSSRE